MKKIRHFKIFCLGLMLCLILSGCAEISNNIRVYPNGEFSLHLKVQIEKEIFEQLNLTMDQSRELVINQFDIKDPESIEEIDTEINGIEYVGFDYSVTYLKDDEKTNIEIIRNTRKNQMVLKVKNELDEDIFFDSFWVGSEEKPNFADLGLDYTLTIEMPGKILNATMGSIDGDIITIDTIKWPSNELVVTSEISSNLVVLLSMAFTVVLIIIILLIIMFINLQHRRIIKKRGAPSKYRIEDKNNEIAETLMLEEKEDELY